MNMNITQFCLVIRIYLETENRIIQELAVCEKSWNVTDRNQKNVLATDTHITFIYTAAMRIVYVHTMFLNVLGLVLLLF